MPQQTSSSTSGERGTTIIDISPPEKPKHIFKAIDEIQKYYVGEINGSPIDPNFLSLLNRWDFWGVGFKGALFSGLVSILMTPLAIGVLEDIIPLFGSSQATTFDKIFAFALALFSSIGYALLAAHAARFYYGNMPRLMIRSLIGGITVAAILKLIVALILYHSVYLFVLTPPRVWGALEYLQPLLSRQWLVWFYYRVMEFKPVLLTSAWFVALSTFLFIFIPVATVIVSDYRFKRMEEDFLL